MSDDLRPLKAGEWVTYQGDVWPQYVGRRFLVLEDQNPDDTTSVRIWNESSLHYLTAFRASLHPDEPQEGSGYAWKQLQQLANFVAVKAPQEPARSGGAVPAAIRIMVEQAEEIRALNQRLQTVQAGISEVRAEVLRVRNELPEAFDTIRREAFEAGKLWSEASAL